MSIRSKAFIAGAYEHPDREIPNKSVAQIHAEVALGALEDAGLRLSDVDAYACDGQLGGGPLSLAEYLGLDHLSFADSTNTGGSSYLFNLGHMVSAMAAGKCHVGLITMAGRPRTEGRRESSRPDAPEYCFEDLYGSTTISRYALVARRHMYEYGTTSAQLAMVKVAAAYHAQFNPHAFLRRPLTIEDVLASPMVSSPLHRMDACVITDGGGAVVVVAPEVARDLPRTCVKVLGQGEAPKHTMNGRADLTFTGAAWSGPRAFEEAGLSPADIDYASIYDSFTITVIETIEDLGFCKKGEGGRFVMDGALHAPDGRLPVNTDGGGLCNNHPNNRGGMTRLIEAVRQVRGEANPEVQVPDCEFVLAHGTGGAIATRMGGATVILGREDA